MALCFCWPSNIIEFLNLTSMTYDASHLDWFVLLAGAILLHIPVELKGEKEGEYRKQF